MVAIQPNVDWLLDYEITLSARQRRFVSLVMVTAEFNQNELDLILSDVVRSSDVYFPEDDGISVVMGETGTTEALQSIERYSQIINGSMNAFYSVASYPTDGKTSSELKNIAQHRMKKARTIESGAIVFEN